MRQFPGNPKGISRKNTQINGLVSDQFKHGKGPHRRFSRKPIHQQDGSEKNWDATILWPFDGENSDDPAELDNAGFPFQIDPLFQGNAFILFILPFTGR